MNELKITSNKSKRYFTIVKDGIKYRTSELSKAEFMEMEFNTDSDWLDFLKSSGSYYVVK